MYMEKKNPINFIFRNTKVRREKQNIWHVKQIGCQRSILTRYSC